MAIYQYKCGSPECTYEGEIQHPMNEPARVECPECKKPELRRLISKSTFHLKGTGWPGKSFKKDKV